MNVQATGTHRLIFAASNLSPVEAVRRDCHESGNFIFAVCEFGFSYLLRAAPRKMSDPEELSCWNIPRDEDWNE